MSGQAQTPRYKRPESVLVVIYTRRGDVLLLERRQPAGYWQSVTGSLKAGETPQAAARREVEEETGLAGARTLRDCRRQNRFAIHPAWRARYAPDTRHNVEHVFAMQLQHVCAININAAEHVRYAWLSRGIALQRVASATNRAAITELVPPPAANES